MYRFTLNSEAVKTAVATVVDKPARGVRIAQLGREPIEVFLEPGEHKTIRDLIEQGTLPSGPTIQYYLNMRPVATEQAVANGDNVVSVQKIKAG
jgi:hypothetical protein